MFHFLFKPISNISGLAIILGNTLTLVLKFGFHFDLETSEKYSSAPATRVNDLSRIVRSRSLPDRFVVVFALERFIDANVMEMPSYRTFHQMLPPQSPLGFSALARLYYLATETKTAKLRRLQIDKMCTFSLALYGKRLP